MCFLSLKLEVENTTNYDGPTDLKMSVSTRNLMPLLTKMPNISLTNIPFIGNDTIDNIGKRTFALLSGLLLQCGWL